MYRLGNIVASGGGGGVSGIAYVRPIGTQQTSYVDYDEAWHVANGTYDYSTQGVKPILEDYWNLGAATPNEFNNLKRFTGKTGGYQDETDTNFYDVDGVATTEALAFPDDYVIDHYTGLGWLRNFSATTVKLVDQLPIVNDASYSQGGYTGDWRIPSNSEIITIFNRDIASFTHLISAYPFECTVNTWMTCSTTNATTYLAYNSASGSSVSNGSIPFLNSSVMPVRTHY